MPHSGSQSDSEEKEGLLTGPCASDEPADEEEAVPSKCVRAKAELTAVPYTHEKPEQTKLKEWTRGPALEAPGETLNLCRICLEEDAVINLDSPCGCAGTQRWAHQACIQRWVQEKGNLRCEVCGQDYKGNYEAPPPPLPPTGSVPPMFIVGPTSTARMSPATEQMQIIEEREEFQRSHPGISCVFTACVFILFLVVMHHSVVIADGEDGGYPPMPNTPPMPAAMDGDPDLSLFLLWVVTKAVMIGLPLWIMMRVASGQAQREQYAAMMRGGAPSDESRRMVFRMQFPPRGMQAV